MLSIYSELHQNIQDQFNEAGIKIASPHYMSLGDGNRIAIPEQYISKSYREPGLAREVENRDRVRDGDVPPEKISTCAWGAPFATIRDQCTSPLSKSSSWIEQK